VIDRIREGREISISPWGGGKSAAQRGIGGENKVDEGSPFLSVDVKKKATGRQFYMKGTGDPEKKKVLAAIHTFDGAIQKKTPPETRGGKEYLG